MPETVAMKITGHKTRSVFDRYDITSEEDPAEASRKPQELAGTISGTDLQAASAKSIKISGKIGGEGQNRTVDTTIFSHTTGAFQSFSENFNRRVTR